MTEHADMTDTRPDARPATRSATRAVYVISVAAELAGMHPQTLRIYERKGLVEPARTQGGSRRYSDDDIAQLREQANQAVEETHRQYRRDLVPVKQAIVLYRGGRRTTS